MRDKMWLGVMLVTMILTVSAPALAEYDEARLERRPSAAAMVADVLLARPLLAVATVGGAAVFVVSLPFSLLGGNVDEAAQALVVEPAESTFLRCLGCTTFRRRVASAQAIE